MKKEKELPGDPQGVNGPSVEELKYTNIKLHEIYTPVENDVVIEEPRLMSKFLEIARAQGENKAPQDMDMVFTIVAIGKAITQWKVGDKVFVKGGSSFPVNLISDKHYQVWGDMVAGTINTEDYEKIRKFFTKKRDQETPKAPLMSKPILGMDGKAMVN